MIVGLYVNVKFAFAREGTQFTFADDVKKPFISNAWGSHIYSHLAQDDLNSLERWKPYWSLQLLTQKHHLTALSFHVSKNFHLGKL